MCQKCVRSQHDRAPDLNNIVNCIGHIFQYHIIFELNAEYVDLCGDDHVLLLVFAILLGYICVKLFELRIVFTVFANNSYV